MKKHTHRLVLGMVCLEILSCFHANLPMPNQSPVSPGQMNWGKVES
jgi:hypothetical protein